MNTTPSEPPGLDALRRRLYEPDASAEDIARYEAATGLSDVGVGAEPGVPPPPDPRRRCRRIGIAVAAVLVIGALVVGARVAGVPAPASTDSTPTDAARTSAARTGEPTSGTAQGGNVLGDIPAPAPARSAFVGALASGARAGVLRYLYAHPDLLPSALRTVGRADSTEYAGTGPAAVALSPSALAERGGRATVIVVLAQTAAYSWRATRPAAQQEPSGPRQTVATQAAEGEAGAPTSATFDYGRGAPSRLAIRVPDGTRWGVVVVFTD